MSGRSCTSAASRTKDRFSAHEDSRRRRRRCRSPTTGLVAGESNEVAIPLVIQLDTHDLVPVADLRAEYHHPRAAPPRAARRADRPRPLTGTVDRRPGVGAERLDVAPVSAAWRVERRISTGRIFVKRRVIVRVPAMSRRPLERAQAARPQRPRSGATVDGRIEERAVSAWPAHVGRPAESIRRSASCASRRCPRPPTRKPISSRGLHAVGVKTVRRTLVGAYAEHAVLSPRCALANTARSPSGANGPEAVLSIRRVNIRLFTSAE